ncbi:MAG: hypothetical protein ABIR30_04900 [Chitinophagaceae bacterium]
MKKIVVMTLVAGMISAFTAKYEPAEPVDARVIAGYTIRENIVSLTDYNLWVMTNAAAFDQLFIPGTTGAARPDFDNEVVLAAKVQTWSNSYTVKYLKSVRKGDELNFYFTVEPGTAKRMGNSVLVASFSRNPEIKKVNFYHGDMLVRSIPIVNVY